MKPLNVFEAPLRGISLVEASAGTGKTYNITSLYVRAIIEKSLLPAQILVLTYTEAATAELKMRLRKRLQESLRAIETGQGNGEYFLEELIKKPWRNAADKLQNAINSFDEASIFTIHGFCHRLLNEYSLQFNVNSNFSVVVDEQQILQDCTDAYWRNFVRGVESPAETYVLQYLVENKYSPDALRDVMQEIMNRPYAQLVLGKYTYAQHLELIKKVLSKFDEIKTLAKTDLQELKEILYSPDLKQTKYRNNAKDGLWQSLNNFLNDEFPSVEYNKNVAKFGSLISREAKKGVTFPVLNISKAIDEFMELLNELRDLKSTFVMKAKEQIQADVEQRKLASNQLSYNDFLTLVEKGLKKSPLLAQSLAREYPIALVDEFQDTDPIQYAIFRHIYHGRERTALFMIGDPKQAIYGFRGADIFTYLSARKDVLPEQAYTLNYNYRSNPKMIEAVNDLFLQSHSPFHIDGLEYEKALSPGTGNEKYLHQKNGDEVKPMQAILLQDNDLSKSDADELVLEALVNEIINLLNGKYYIGEEPVRQKDIAVLVRKNIQGEKVQELLRRHGIKSVLKVTNSVFATREATDLLTILQATIKDFYEPGLRAALATDLIGKTAEEIQQLAEDEHEWAGLVSIFSEIKAKWQQGIEPALEFMFQAFDIKKRLMQFTDAERRFTNVMHIAELLAMAEHENRLHSNSLLKWLNRKIYDENTKVREDEIRLESDDNLIQISTIHAAKGLEYPIVFCPFLWEPSNKKNASEIYRFYEDGKVYVDINTGLQDDQRRVNQEKDMKDEIRESIRLLYVALTRSATACYVFLPSYKEIRLSAIAAVINGEEQMNEEINVGAAKSAFSYEELVSRIQAGRHIEVREFEASDIPSLTEPASAGYHFEAQPFTRNDLNQYYRILSYSSIAKTKSEADDAALDYDEDDALLLAVEPELNELIFPRGAGAGTCLHNIFEETEFSQPGNLNEIVERNLRLSGLDEQFSDNATKWINHLLRHNLGTPNTALANLKAHQVLKEMEFHFPIRNLHIPKLWKLVRGSDSHIAQQTHEWVSGYLKGFIDLIFEYEGQFFILDYKSNYLGSSPADYSPEELKAAINASAYDMQYHIYIVALHRLLGQKLDSYSYKRHFGGVLYYFLRGADESLPGSGVYFHKPEESRIRSLDAYMANGGMK